MPEIIEEKSDKCPDGKKRIWVKVMCVFCNMPVWKQKRWLNEKAFCSKDCQYKYRTKKIHLKCANCGKDVVKKPCDTKNKTHLFFCNRKCKDEANTNNIFNRTKEINCFKCGDKIEVDSRTSKKLCFSCKHPSIPLKKKEKGRILNSNGYVMIGVPPNYKGSVLRQGWVYEHRVILEEKLGRLLTEDEITHHINENKQDNRPSNLEISNRKEHSKIHGFKRGVEMVELKCPACHKFFERPKRKTHLVRGGFFTACSRNCRNKIRIGKTNLSENVIKIFRKYVDRSSAVERLAVDEEVVGAAPIGQPILCRYSSADRAFDL